MKIVNSTNIRTCPLCEAQYSGYPATSRKDATLLICPDCGTREALESIGVSEKEQESILEIIHNIQR